MKLFYTLLFCLVIQLSQAQVNAGPDISICVGVSGTLNATGAVTYSWSPAGGLSDANIPNPICTAVSTVAYTVTGTDANGVQTTDQVIVTVKQRPAVNAGADVSICEGQTVQLNATGALSYTWSPNAGLSAYNVANPTAGPAVTTTYTVTGFNAEGCSNTDEVQVTVIPKPSVNAGTDVSICPGGKAILSGGTTGCSWSPSTGLSSTTSCTPQANPSVTTTYTLTKTGTGGCTNTDQVIVEVLPTPIITLNSTDGMFYTNLGTLLPDVSVTNYTWKNASSANGTYSTMSCNGMSSCLKVPSRPYTKVTVTYSVPDGSCSLTSAVTTSRIAANTSITESTDALIVYPVPAQNEIYVEYAGDTTLSGMIMYDALGKEILHSEINANMITVDLHSIPVGVYVIHFIDARSVLHIRRVEIIH